MSKIKVSKSDVKNCYKKVVAVGYCDLQYLLKCEDAILYSSGYYGWCCDYYIFDELIISTGYSPVGEDVDYKLVRKYNEKAQQIEYKTDWQQYKKDHRKLIKKFINEILKEK